MKTLNKSLLAAAVIGAIALPGMSSAATLAYSSSKQITHATDLVSGPGIYLITNDDLRLTAAGAVDAGNLSLVSAGHELRVRIALTGGAKFDSSSVSAPALASAFLQGAQTGGFNTPVAVVPGSASYSNIDAVLEFRYYAAGAGTLGAPGDYALELPPFQVINLEPSLGSAGGSLNANITVNHVPSGLQILAGNTTIAKSEWGVTVRAPSSASSDTAKTIDVGISNGSTRRTYFSPNGDIGNSNTVPGDSTFNANGFNIRITQAPETGGGLGFVNDINSTALLPWYNVVGTSTIDVTISGTNLGPWQGTGNIWLDSNTNCAHGSSTSVDLTVASANAPTATATNIPGNHFIFNSFGSGIATAPPGSSDVYVCFKATAGIPGTPAMIPQSLSGSLSLNNGLSALRINPPPYSFSLYPLVENGSTFYFQNVNPGGNATAQSFLRLSNHNAFDCPVRIEAKDDLGQMSGIVDATMDAHESKQFNSDALENGSSEFTGRFRDGAGKWFVRVTAECTNFTASALNRNANTGVVTDLTPQSPLGNQWSDSGTPVP